jgi:hypothetical protein
MRVPPDEPTPTPAADTAGDADGAPPRSAAARETDRRKELPYALVLACGADDLPPFNVPVVDVTPAAQTVDAVLEAIKQAGLSVADVKTNALVVFGPGDVVGNLVVYTALCGLAGRRLDVGVAGRILPAGNLDQRVRRAKDAGPPAERPLHVQIGATGRTDLPELTFETLSDPAALSTIRSAKRCRLVPPADPLTAVHQLVAISAIRARGDEERMPFLVAGGEPAPTVDTAADPVGIDLEAIRREASAMRRETRNDDRSVLAEPSALSPRQERLNTAAEVDVNVLLRRLGVRYHPGEDAWHCPRTGNHTNGDAVPSMRVTKGKARCGRCDGERLDGLRLVMEVTGLSPDEAADWILAV